MGGLGDPDRPLPGQECREADPQGAGGKGGAYGVTSQKTLILPESTRFSTLRILFQTSRISGLASPNRTASPDPLTPLLVDSGAAGSTITGFPSWTPNRTGTPSTAGRSASVRGAQPLDRRPPQKAHARVAPLVTAVARLAAEGRAGVRTRNPYPGCRSARRPGARVFELLREIERERGTAFLFVTHDPGIAGRCDRIVHMIDGRIDSDSAAEGAEGAAG